MSSIYQIKIKGHLDQRYSTWFDHFAFNHTPDGHTLLTGEVPDQAALHGVFSRCRDLGLTLISANPLSETVDPTKGETPCL